MKPVIAAIKHNKFRVIDNVVYSARDQNIDNK